MLYRVSGDRGSKKSQKWTGCKLFYAIPAKNEPIFEEKLYERTKTINIEYKRYHEPYDGAQYLYNPQYASKKIKMYKK